MKKKISKLIAILTLAVSMTAVSFVPAASVPVVITAQAANISLPVKVIFGQEDARSILGMINELRTGSDAWYWNPSNTQKVSVNGLRPLQYDEGLEQAAMQRAAEIAVSYSHTRPNGTSCFIAIAGSFYALGENIAAGWTSASSVNEGWREDDMDYSGQGHRRNMLSNEFSYVGIGHAVVGGVDYWVEEFASNPVNVSYSFVDGEQDVNVDVDESTIVSRNIELKSDLSEMKVGDSVTLPEADTVVQTSGYWGRREGTVVDIPVTAGISDTDVAELTGNTITAKKAGSFDITYTSSYSTKILTVQVTEKEYEVYFDSNGGSHVASIVCKGKIDSELPTPRRKGYDFEGWYTEDGDKVTKGTVISDDITLIAHWNKKAVSVTSPSKVTGITIKRSGAKKAKIRWKKVSSADVYDVRVKAGSSSYRFLTSKNTVSVKAKKGQKITVKINAIRYDKEGTSYKSGWVKKTKKL